MRYYSINKLKIKNEVSITTKVFKIQLHKNYWLPTIQAASATICVCLCKHNCTNETHFLANVQHLTRYNYKWQKPVKVGIDLLENVFLLCMDGYSYSAGLCLHKQKQID